MPKCPKCEAEIDRLEGTTREIFHYVVRLPVSEVEKTNEYYDVDTGLMWFQDMTHTTTEDSLVCPSCQQELTQDLGEAANILRGG